jgi:hypothetical protein
MYKIIFTIVITILILPGCSKQGPQPTPTTHYRVRFLNEVTGTPIPLANINLQELKADACNGNSGWGCLGTHLEYWGQLVTDANGYIDFRQKGVFYFQPEEDSLWNPFLYENPASPPAPVAEVDETCYLFPITMLGVTTQKGEFQAGTVNVGFQNNLPHFAHNDFDLSGLSTKPGDEALVHLLKGVENQVKLKIYASDGTNRDSLITITPTTGDKIRITLPY